MSVASWPAGVVGVAHGLAIAHGLRLGKHPAVCLVGPPRRPRGVGQRGQPALAVRALIIGEAVRFGGHPVAVRNPCNAIDGVVGVGSGDSARVQPRLEVPRSIIGVGRAAGIRRRLQRRLSESVQRVGRGEIARIGDLREGIIEVVGILGRARSRIDDLGKPIERVVAVIRNAAERIPRFQSIAAQVVFVFGAFQRTRHGHRRRAHRVASIPRLGTRKWCWRIARARIAMLRYGPWNADRSRRTELRGRRRCQQSKENHGATDADPFVNTMRNHDVVRPRRSSGRQ